ncbi:MAG TPA: hypothetical protein VFI30_05980 [Nocardioidaceae bacterium]|nr:hypothetical protein [Nocardioidaceae bacterium]
MRIMLRIRVGTKSGSEAIASGTLPKTMETLIAELRPEASYFFPDRGRRSALFVFDMADPSQLPAISEPLFANLDAEVYVTPVMNLDDLTRGLKQLASTT